MLRKTALLITLLLFCTSAYATTGKVVDFLLGGVNTLAGGVLSGGKVYTYAAGTTSEKALYSDRELTTAIDNPATLDTDGRLVAYGSGVYKFVITTSFGNSVFTADNVELSSLESAFDETEDPFGPDLTQTNLTVTNLTASSTITDSLEVGTLAVINSLSVSNTVISDVATGTDVGDAVNVGQFEAAIASISWEASGPTDIGTDKNVVIDGNLTVTGDIEAERVGVFACLSSAASTTTTLADTWYPIQGTFSNDPIEGFSIATDSIQYDSDVTRHMQTTISCSIRSNIASTELHIGIYVNGVLNSCSVMANFNRNVDEEYNITTVAVFELSQNDTVQLVVMSDQAGAVLTFDHLTTSIREFFD